jgi:hypothetical protein
MEHIHQVQSIFITNSFFRLSSVPPPRSLFFHAKTREGSHIDCGVIVHLFRIDFTLDAPVVHNSLEVVILEHLDRIEKVILTSSGELSLSASYMFCSVSCILVTEAGFK